jgi:hypothetical protein
MPAEEIWHAQLEAVRRGDWDTMSGSFAPDRPWTLMPPGTTFRGPAEIAGFPRSGFGAAAGRDEADVRNEFATGERGVFGYTSRGVIDAERAAQFAEKTGVAGHGAGDLAGRRFEIPVCFTYHVNAKGLIDRVSEYATIPGLPA